MKHLLGLGFALFLGVVAAGMNLVWMSGLATPDEYVGFNSDMEAGTNIADGDLIAIPVPGDPEKLPQSLVPFKDRAILLGLKATRDYTAGDVVLQSDIHAPAESSRWDVVGPFELIGVGERFRQTSTDDAEYTRTDGNNLTIAVDANFDAKTRQLLELISPNPGSTAAPGIAAVQVLAPNNERLSSVRPASSVQMVYQTISLEGIAHVPRVLLEGDMIQFVIRARPEY